MTTTELLRQAFWKGSALRHGACSTELHGYARAVEDAAVLSPSRRRTARSINAPIAARFGLLVKQQHVAAASGGR